MIKILDPEAQQRQQEHEQNGTFLFKIVNLSPRVLIMTSTTPEGVTQDCVIQPGEGVLTTNVCADYTQLLRFEPEV